MTDCASHCLFYLNTINQKVNLSVENITDDKITIQNKMFCKESEKSLATD